MSKPNSPPKQNVCEDRHNQKVMKAAKKNADSLICLWSYEKSERNAKIPPKVCEECEKNTNKVCGDDGKTREIKIDTIFERTTHKKGAKTKKTNETEMVPMKPPKTDVVALENFPTSTTKKHSTEAKSKKGAHKKHNKMDAIKISASTTNLRQIKPQYEIPLKKTSHAHKSTKKHQKVDDRELICYYKNESNLVSDASSKNVYFDGECSYQTPKIICKCFVDESSELHIKNTCHKDPSNKLIDVEVINTTFGTTTKISDEFIDCTNTNKLKSLIPKPIENLDYKIECCLKRFPRLYQNQDLCGMDVDLHQGSWSDVPNAHQDLCGFNTTICSDETSDETSTENLAESNPGYQPLRKLYEQKYGSMNAIKEQIESVNEEISNMIKSALFKIETKSNYCCLNADISDTSDDDAAVPNFSTHQNFPLGHHRSVSTLKRKSTEDVTVPKKKFKEDSPIFRLLENALEVYQEQERAKSESSGNTPENLMVRQMFSMLSHMEVLLEEYFHGGGGGGYAHATLVCGCDKRFTCDKSSQTAITERLKPKSRYTIQTYTVFCSTLSSAETQTLNQTQTQRLVEAKSSIFGRLKKFVTKTKSDQTLTEDTKREMVENETQTDPKPGKFFGKIRTAVKFLSKKHSKTRQPDDTKNDPKMLSPMPSTSGSMFSTNKITQTYITTDTNIEEGFIKTVDLTEDTEGTKRTKNSGHKKDTLGSSDLVELHHTHNTDGGLTPMGSLGVLSEDTTLTVPYQKTNPEPALKHLTKPPKKAPKTKKNVKKKKNGKELGQNEEFGMETIEGDLERFDEVSLDCTLKDDFELKQLKMRKLVEKVHGMDRYYYKIALPKVGGDENMGQKKLEDGTIELSLDNVNLEEFDLEFSGLDKKSATKSACTSTCVNTKDVVVEAHVDTTDVGTQPPKSPPKRDNYTQFEGCTSVCIDTTHRSSLDLVPSLNSDAKKKRTTTHDYLVQNTPTLLKQAGHTHNTPLLRLRLDSNTKIEKGTKISIPSDESGNKLKCFNFDGFIGNRRDVLENHTQLTHTTAHNCSIPNTPPKVQTQPTPPPPEENLSNYYIVYMPEKPSEGESHKNSAADFKIWYYFQNMPKSIPEIKSTTTLPNSTSTTTTNDTTSSSIFQKILLLKKHSNTHHSDGDDDYVGRGDGYRIPNTSLDGDNLNNPKRIVGVQYVTLPMVISDGEEIHRERRRTSQNCF